MVRVVEVEVEVEVEAFRIRVLGSTTLNDRIRESCST